MTTTIDPAAPPPSPGAVPGAAAALPAPVRRHVEIALATLAMLARGRQTDACFGRTGRYEAEVFLNNQPALERAWNTLAEFERLCRPNGVDAQLVYAELGTPESLSEAARAWLADSHPAALTSSDAARSATARSAAPADPAGVTP